jgi:hypothetical protein
MQWTATSQPLAAPILPVGGGGDSASNVQFIPHLPELQESSAVQPVVGVASYLRQELLVHHASMSQEKEDSLFTPPSSQLESVLPIVYTVTDDMVPEECRHFITSSSEELMRLLGKERGFRVADLWRSVEHHFGYAGPESKVSK